MFKWLEKKLPIEKLRNDLRINDEYFEPEPLPPLIVSPAMIHVFQIPLITNKIFDYLTLRDLTTCRLVHPCWSDPATDFICRNDMSQVTITYDHETKSFHRRPFVPQRDRRNKKLAKYYDLRILNKLLQKSLNFPCQDYQFCGGNLADGEAQKFFAIEGKLIKTLTLQNTTLELIERSEVNTGTKQKKRGRSAEMRKLEEFDNLEPNNLSSLTCFSWLNSEGSALKVLMSANNLQLIPSVNFVQDFPLLAKSNKIAIIHSLDLMPYRDMSHLMSQFLKAEPNPKLRKLTLHEPIEEVTHKEWTRSIIDLIHACSLYLHFLTLPDLTSFEGMEWPHFRHLTTLQLTSSKINPRPLFPDEANIGQIFPTLMTLDLSDLFCDDDENWDVYFPPANTPPVLPSVMTLTLPDGVSEGWFGKLGRLCPNFKNLCMKSKIYHVMLSSTLPMIFKYWRHIQYMDFIFNDQGPINFCLDPAFTGMDQNVCVKLWLQFRNTEEHCDIRNLLRGNQNFRQKYEKLKIQPSICDLKDLKGLTIHCTQLFPERDFPLTWVSGLFAFGMMPNSDVYFKLIYHNRNVDLESLKFHHITMLPYVQLTCDNDMAAWTV